MTRLIKICLFFGLATAGSYGVVGATQPLYVDMTAANLPIRALSGFSMDAEPIDVDADGDLDLMIAVEFRPNVLLINNGHGQFANGSECTRIHRGKNAFLSGLRLSPDGE